MEKHLYIVTHIEKSLECSKMMGNEKQSWKLLESV